MIRGFTILTITAGLGLAACAPKTETTSLPVIDPNMPGAQACKAAIAKTAKTPPETITMTQTLPMTDGTQVTATIAGYKGSWTCIGHASGKVSGVAYTK
ncbi:MAG: hypothetical protein QM656_07810 [Paracoccaceae bacterium]